MGASSTKERREELSEEGEKDMSLSHHIFPPLREENFSL